jgi:hypothetical protein
LPLPTVRSASRIALARQVQACLPRAFFKLTPSCSKKCRANNLRHYPRALLRSVQRAIARRGHAENRMGETGSAGSGRPRMKEPKRRSIRTWALG